MKEKNNFEYYYNYLKNYIDEVGDRIIGKDSAELNDEFIRDRAEYAVSVLEAETKAGTIAPYEVAMHVLMEGLTELEPTEEEKRQEEEFQRNMAEDIDFIR
jgi:hypothetical protein